MRLEPSLAASMAAGGVPGNVTLVVIRNGTDPYAQVHRNNQHAQRCACAAACSLKMEQMQAQALPPMHIGCFF